MLIQTADIFITIAFVSILIFLIVIFVFVASSKSRSQKEIKGTEGEMLVSNMLNSLVKDIGGYLINDVIIPTKKSTTEIDHILFCKKGIFVIETKNFIGIIEGKEEDKEWKQYVGNYSACHFHYNPVMQNEGHIISLKKLIRNYITFYNIVIFTNGNIRLVDSDKVFDLDNAKDFIKSQEDKFNENIYIQAYKTILYYKNNPIASREEHINNINSNM